VELNLLAMTEKYDGMETSDSKRLKQVKAENHKLK
jgi:hypothetical protein